jgi:hypothetical protein
VRLGAASRTRASVKGEIAALDSPAGLVQHRCL